jgi:LmbE family N-acetylglucosaminyl deacetylase
VDIGTTLDVKIEALRQHKSQPGDWDPAEMITQWAAERAEGKEVAYAEGFRRMILVRDDERQPKEPEPGQDEVYDRP